MKSYNQRVRTRFAPESRFDVKSAPAAPLRGAVETQLDRLKDGLLLRHLNEAAVPELKTPMQRAANEAAALAWLTPFPLLFFPALLEEKVQTARKQAAKQARVRRLSRALLAEEA